jgi:hypothetical protein
MQAIWASQELLFQMNFSGKEYHSDTTSESSDRFATIPCTQSFGEVVKRVVASR